MLLRLRVANDVRMTLMVRRFDLVPVVLPASSHQSSPVNLSDRFLLAAVYRVYASDWQNKRTSFPDRVS